MTPPQPCAPSPPPSPAHHVRQDVQHTTVERQWYQQTDGTNHLPRGARRQSSRLKSKHPELHPTLSYGMIDANAQEEAYCFLFIAQVSFTRKPLSTTSKNDPHLEEVTISITMDNTEFLITNVYIPPASSCNGRYSPPIDHLLTGTDSLVLGDFNAHHSLWHSGTTDKRGTTWPMQMTSQSHPHTQVRVQPRNTYNHTYTKFLPGQNKTTSY